MSSSLHALHPDKIKANIAKSDAINFDQLKASATEAANLLKSLSHPDRLLLLCQLVQGEACVQDLEQLTGIRQPSLSQQLGILRGQELVATRREGRQIYYSIASDDAMAILEVLYQRFCGAAKDL